MNNEYNSLYFLIRRHRKYNETFVLVKHAGTGIFYDIPLSELQYNVANRNWWLYGYNRYVSDTGHLIRNRYITSDRIKNMMETFECTSRLRESYIDNDTYYV